MKINKVEENIIQKDEVFIVLEKLCNSKIILNKGHNAAILRFLTTCYFEKRNVKETVIAIELLGQTVDEALKDGKVRRQMYALRKKLNEYYSNEGANDKIIFHIKKGQYNLSIEKKQNTVTSSKTKKIYLIVLLAILCLGIFGLWNWLFPANNYCWSSFFKKDASNICCVGDHYIMLGNVKDTNNIAFYSSKINTDKDFEAYRKSSKAYTTDTKKAYFSFSTKMGAVGSANIARWFTLNNAEAEVYLESELSPDILKNNNFVFIGSYKTMDKMRGVFLNNSQKYGYDGQHIYYKSDGKRINESYNQLNKSDYVMVSYNKLSYNGNKIIFFTSNNDIGVMATVKRFTDSDWLKSFCEEELPNSDVYFNALFLIKGINRTDLSCELIEVEILDE